MPKRPRQPEVTPPAFSIARQFTGPPFSHTLASAELRRKLMLEMELPRTPPPVAPVPPPRRRRQRKGKAIDAAES
ncbi:MAG: hypothetical protein JNG83_02135 [Opitutaceae bacterium]|nr:hypothetical protein [Opitutaceae bacterium]